MGGKVLELDIVKARHEGIEQGIEQGIERLAKYYMSQDQALSKDKAHEMAAKILS